ncbi:MAG TPA: CmpA/NrtA family ABC transporter substrate-binding protein [Devosia sp.]
MSTYHLTAGFLPLLDSVLMVLAREKGFAEEEGLDLHLVRESSWANIRDRAAIGHFPIAQMLAPMPIAASVGLTPIATPTIAPIALGLGNNAVTVSAGLWQSMQEQGAPGDLQARAAGAALRAVVANSVRKLRFGVVHQTSSHNYELRYWLAASGIRPDCDIEIVVLPPPLLPDALDAGSIDGYCVGEPWNSIGVTEHGAHIATVKASIWRTSPDKVLGMRADWAEQHPDIVAAAIRAIYRAGVWCSDPANHQEIAAVMAREAYLGVPAEIVGRALSGVLDSGDGLVRQVPDFFVPHRDDANFPWKSHALWYYAQMVRWGEVMPSQANAEIAAGAFRPDLYRAALTPLRVPVPAADYKAEDAAAFFDGLVFDPDQLDDYLADQRP